MSAQSSAEPTSMGESSCFDYCICYRVSSFPVSLFQVAGPVCVVSLTWLT